jgi:hypothetical protein
VCGWCYHRKLPVFHDVYLKNSKDYWTSKGQPKNELVYCFLHLQELGLDKNVFEGHYKEYNKEFKKQIKIGIEKAKKKFNNEKEKNDNDDKAQ